MIVAYFCIGRSIFYIGKGIYNIETWCSEKWNAAPPKPCRRGTKGEKRAQHFECQ